MQNSGIVLVNKKAGMSSNTAVNIVKRVLGAKKCGHLGTLDLEGEGLLPVTVNSATRLFDFFLKKDKTYQTTFVFGVETDTLDASGKVLRTKECYIQEEDVLRVCKEMTGKYLQMPPLYSAKKVDGKVAYKEARTGEEISLSPKEVEITNFRLLKKEKKNTFTFEISCSSGTYIRSVARDMAEKLSTYGIMHCILRTRCGQFLLKDANTIEEIKSGKFKLIPCEDLFDFEKIFLTEEQTSKILNGQILKIEKQNGRFKIYSNEKFLGLGVVESGNLKLTLRLM